MMKLCLLTFFLCIAAFTSISCSCEGPATVGEAFQEASIVFHGRVKEVRYASLMKTIDSAKAGSLSSDDLRFLTSPQLLEITLDVLNVYKGDISTQSFKIYTPVSDAACGYTSFLENREYIIYGASQNFLLSILNSKSIQLKKAELLVFWAYACGNTTGFSAIEDGQLIALKRAAKK